MNLVICLLSTRQFITAEKIRASVSGYEDSVSDEAFFRKFERDKSDLRDLGVPLETGRISRLHSAEGYRINRGDYELPEIELDSEEAAAVAVAVQLWESPELTSAAQGALLKLRAAGIQVDSDSSAVTVSATPPRSRGSEPALHTLLDAINAGRAVQFEHRPARNEPFRLRTVEPWGVVTHRGRWYLVGHDRDRVATRTFRLSRIAAAVRPIGPANAVRKPDGIDLRAVVADTVSTSHTNGLATVWVACDRAQELRRLGRDTGASEINGRAGAVLEVEFNSWDWITRVVAGYGADAIALQPTELRESVIARLTQAAAPIRPGHAPEHQAPRAAPEHQAPRAAP